MIDYLIEKLPHISCQEATRLLSDGMDRKLTFKEMVLLMIHLGVCELCKRFGWQIKHMRQLLRNYSPQKEHTLPDEWKDNLKKSLQTK